MSALRQSDAPRIRRALQETETLLAVPGMHCAGCMSKIERGLASIDGIEAARVNLSSRLVRVTHGSTVKENDLVHALADLGFEAQPRSPEITAPVSAVKPLLAPLAVAFFAAMNVMLLSVSVWSGAEGSTRSLFHLISAIIAVPAIAYAGQPFFRSAWQALRKGTTSMDVPVSIGVVIATGLSIYETATHGRHAWFDGALMLLTFLLAGRVLDAMMRDKARSGVDALLSQAATGATVVSKDGSVSWVAARDLESGMIMRVAAGERLAADGEIIAGASRFDRSLLTGETDPVAAQTGDSVLAGTLNMGTPVDVRISQTERSSGWNEPRNSGRSAHLVRSAAPNFAEPYTAVVRIRYPTLAISAVSG